MIDYNYTDDYIATNDEGFVIPQPKPIIERED